jgi:hypothetical protein
MQLSEELDDVKKMNQMMLYAKVVTIRDAQVPAAPPPPPPLPCHPSPPSLPPPPRRPALPTLHANPARLAQLPTSPLGAGNAPLALTPTPPPPTHTHTTPLPLPPRPSQCTEKKVIEKERQEEERRLDTIMEIERLKALQMYSEREKKQSQVPCGHST